MKKNVITRGEEGDFIKLGITSIWFVFSFSSCVCSISYLGGWNFTSETSFWIIKSHCKTEFAWTGLALWAEPVTFCLALVCSLSLWLRLELDGDSSFWGKYLYAAIYIVYWGFSTCTESLKHNFKINFILSFLMCNEITEVSDVLTEINSFDRVQWT